MVGVEGGLGALAGKVPSAGVQVDNDIQDDQATDAAFAAVGDAGGTTEAACIAGAEVVTGVGFGPEAEAEAEAEADAAEAEVIGGGASPLRRCVASGLVQTKTLMVRLVVAPDGHLVPDVAERLPGRGFWVTCDRALFQRAIARKVFAKVARRSVIVDGALLDRTVALLEQRCLDAIGLARRAGQVVAGFEKASEALRRGRLGHTRMPNRLVLAACDGGVHGRQAVAALAGTLPVVDMFDAAALGAALGQERAVHAVMAVGGLAERLLVDAARLAGLKGCSPAWTRCGKPGAVDPE